MRPRHNDGGIGVLRKILQNATNRRNKETKKTDGKEKEKRKGPNQLAGETSKKSIVPSCLRSGGEGWDANEKKTETRFHIVTNRQGEVKR